MDKERNEGETKRQKKVVQEEGRKRGRPETRVVKIDDTPRNIARALFGIKSDKFKGKPQ